MAPGDRRPVRLPLPLLLLLWVVTSSLFSTGLCSGEEFSVCNTQCCSVEPNCSSALHVSCRCQDERMVALGRGDFPASVQSIYIYGVRKVVIYENALLDLTSLVKVELKWIDKLTVKPHGLALRKNASLFTFDMDIVKKLKIESSAFSGFWELGTRIKMGYISKIYIQQNAFSFQSLSRSPSLTIEKAKFLDMAPKAFNAPFTFLSLSAVNIPMCRRNNFSGLVRRIEMKEVQIREVKKGCINGTGDLNWLSMFKCNLGIIRKRGICGEIRNVTIHNSNVTMVQPNGFQLQVGSLGIERSTFKSVKTRGLNVLANNLIYLSSVKVHTLHRHALIALKFPRNQVDSRTSMTIYNLTVMHAKNGSLMFDKAVDLELNHLSVRHLENPVCPTIRWVRWLTGTAESDPLSQRDQQILTELNQDWLCQNSHTAANVDPTAEEEDEWIIPLLVLVVLVVLFLLLGLGRSYCNETSKRSGTDLTSGSVTSGSGNSKADTEITVTDSVGKSKLRKRKKQTVDSNKS